MADFGALSRSHASHGAEKSSPPIGFDRGYEQRQLSVVLAELMLAEGELKIIASATQFRQPNMAEDARWSRLEDAINARRDEAKALISAATGVSWDAIEGANL